MLDAVFAAHLLDDQLAVAADDDPPGAEFPGLLHRGDERLVLRDVVRRPPDVPPERDQRRPVRRLPHPPDPRRPWIPPAAAVKLQRKPFIHGAGCTTTGRADNLSTALPRP